jgi:hypothetical protein
LRLSKLSLIVLGASTILGLLPGIIAQLEILAPGLQVFPADDPGLYNITKTLHAAALSQALPLAAIAFSLSVAAEALPSPLLHLIARLVLIAGPVAFAVMAWAGLTQAWDIYGAMHRNLSTYAFFLVFANIRLAITQRGARAALIVLTVLSVVALAMGMFIDAINNSSIDSVLHDTYAVVAADHALGVSVLLGMAAGATAHVMQTRAIRTLAGSIIGGGAIVLTGYFAMSLTFRAGLMGMPRGYVDYAPAFADVLQAASVWTLALALAVIIAFGWILSNLRHKPPPGPEAAFD